MPIFCQKNVHPLKNTVLSCHFFQIFHEKSHAVMPIFGQINVNSVKNTLYYLSKKSIWCPFLPIFLEKKNCTHAHILSKKRPFSKKQTGLMPIFCQKNVLSLKNTKLLCNCFQIFHEKPPADMPICSQKTSILSKPILWAKKVNRMPFFSDFSRKNQCSHAHILSKKSSIL